MKGIIMNKKFYFVLGTLLMVFFLIFFAMEKNASPSEYVWESWTDDTAESSDTSGTYHIWNHSTEEGYQHEGHIEKDPFSDRWIIYKGYGPDRKGYIKKDPFSGKHYIYDADGARQGEIRE
jgi:hypothetical protein